MKNRNFYVISLLTYLAITIVFLTQVVLVNILSVSDYGIYATSIAIISMIEAPLISRGSELTLKKAGEKWNNFERNDALAIIRYINKSEKTLYWSAFCLMSLAAVLLSFVTDIKVIYILILALSIPMQIGFSAYKSFLTITNKVHLQSVVELSFAITVLVLCFIGVSLFGLIGLLISIVLSSFLKMRVSRYIYYNELKKYDLEINADFTYEIDRAEYKRRSLNSYFKIFTQNGITQIDIIILGIFQRPEIVAIYKVGKTLAGVPTKVSIPVWKILYPRLVKSVNTNDFKLQRFTIIRGSAITFVLFVAICIASFAFGEKVINILYGSEYADAYSVFFILLIGYGVFYAINGWFKIWVALIDKMMIGSIFYLTAFLGVAALSYLYSGNIVKLSSAITLLLIALTCFSYFLGLMKDKPRMQE